MWVKVIHWNVASTLDFYFSRNGPCTLRRHPVQFVGPRNWHNAPPGPVLSRLEHQRIWEEISQSWPTVAISGPSRSVFGDREGCQSYRPAISLWPSRDVIACRVAKENRDGLRRSKEDVRSENTGNAAEPRVGRMSELFILCSRRVQGCSKPRLHKPERVSILRSYHF